MKRYNKIITFLLFILTVSTIAQPRIPQDEWVHSYGQNLNDRFQDVFITEDGNYAMCGSNVVGNSHDQWLLVTTPAGEVIIDQK